MPERAIDPANRALAQNMGRVYLLVNGVGGKVAEYH